MSSLYLFLHLFTLSFPLVRSFEPKVKYATRWKALFPAIIITATFFLIWDVVFTKSGVWGFNPAYLVGLSLFGLPIEEWLFFFTIPFASMFIYDCIWYFLPKVQTKDSLRYGTMILGIALLVFSFLNIEKSYTFWNFLFAGGFLMIVSFANPDWLGKFWIAYVIHLIPFLIINGVLTGSFIESPIVWYNNSENLSFRIVTIPVEDTVYALLLLLMNVSIYEALNKHFQLRT